MLDAVIRFSLKHRPLIVFACLIVLGYGGYLATTMPVDIFPDLDRPRVAIIVEAPGMAPQAIEEQVAHPIETAMLGSQGVEAVRSVTSPGLTVVYVEFDWSTPIRSARQTVLERLAIVQDELPPGLTPQLAPVSSILGQIMHIGVYRRVGPNGGDLAVLEKSSWVAERVATAPGIKLWNPEPRDEPKQWTSIPIRNVEFLKAPNGAGEERFRVSAEGKELQGVFPSALEQQRELEATARWTIRPRLLQTPGLAEVLIIGGDRMQYQVVVRPEAIEEYALTLEEVEQAVKRCPVATSGGFAIRTDSERPVRVLGLLGPLSRETIAQLKSAFVKQVGDERVLLDKVADVIEASPPKRGDASVDGQRGVVITVVKQPHVDTRQLSEQIVTALSETEVALPPTLAIETELFQLRRFIDQGIYYVGEALVIGAVLVLIILTLFLLNVRTTFISLTAIPLSLAITVLVFRIIGKLTGTELSINVMTLGGLAVAMGELVDDAIVDVENIFRRLKENAVSAQPKSAIRVVYEASREVRGAIVFGTIVVILVFLPLFALSGLEGRLFTPLGIAYILSILASLVVSLMVTPVLSYYLLPQSRAAHHKRDGWLLRSLKAGARPMIRLSMARAGSLLLLVWMLVVFAAWHMTRLGSNFLPPFDEGSVQINLTLPPGSSLEASNSVCDRVDQALLSLQASEDEPDKPILHFLRRSGRAQFDEHAEPVSATEYIVNINPHSGLRREEVLEQLRATVKDFAPDAEAELEQPLAHLISHMLTGVTSQLAVKIQGERLEKLQQVARRVKAEADQVKGVRAVIQAQRLVEEVHIELRRAELALLGIDAEHVARFLQTALQGTVVTHIRDGLRRHEVLVRLPESIRDEPEKLKELRIPRDNGVGSVALGEIAYVREVLGPNLINRENGRRMLVVRCSVTGRDLGSAAEEVEQRLRGVKLPEGYTATLSGQHKAQQRAAWTIGLLSLVALAGIFMVLMILYPSVRIVLQVLNAVPVAFVGGVLALSLTGQTMSVASMVGFVSLGGIAVRNGILLMSHYLHLMRSEGEGFTKEMVLRGSLERLAPVLMTALTAGIALLPIVLGGQKPGLEVLYPVATVILGGLMTSTLCEFLIHPGLFWRFSGHEGLRLAHAKHEPMLTRQESSAEAEINTNEDRERR